MTKVKITAPIRALKPRSKEYLHSVPGERGLYVCVRPNGTKPFAFRYTSPLTNKRRLMMLDVNDITEVKTDRERIAILEDAIAATIQLRKDVADQIDPLELAKREQEANIGDLINRIDADKLTVELMCQWYIGYLYGGFTPEQRAKMSPSAIKKMEGNGRRSAKVADSSLAANVYPLIGHIKASEVTVRQCTAIRDRIMARGAKSQANRVMSHLTAAYNFVRKAEGKASEDNALLKYYASVPDFGVTYNPAADVGRFNEDRTRRQNEVTLKPTELARLWAEVGVDCMSYQMALALKLLMSTGQRVEEVLDAEKSEFTINDDGTGEWAIPQARRKTRDKTAHDEPHIVPLLKIHTDLVKEAKTLAGRGKCLFPAHDGAPRSSDALNQSVRRFCIPQGDSHRKPFPIFTPRDLRRSFKTLVSTAGADDNHLDRLQGHNVKDIASAHYNRYDKIIEKRLVMQTFVQAMDALVNVKATDDAEELRQIMLERNPPDNVVVFARG